jgi:hypothetical protein
VGESGLWWSLRILLQVWTTVGQKVHHFKVAWDHSIYINQCFGNYAVIILTPSLNHGWAKVHHFKVAWAHSIYINQCFGNYAVIILTPSLNHGWAKVFPKLCRDHTYTTANHVTWHLDEMELKEFYLIRDTSQQQYWLTIP